MTLMESNDERALFPVINEKAYGRIQGAAFGLLMRQLDVVYDRNDLTHINTYENIAEVLSHVLNGNEMFPSKYMIRFQCFIFGLIHVCYTFNLNT